MDPLTIRSKDEERILFDLIQQNEMFHDDNYYHVGAPLVGNEWKWTSDSSLVLPTIKWVSGEPNNHLDNEKCLSIYKSKDKDSTGFNDIFCETKRRFLCQSSKDPITPQPVVEVTTEHAETVTKKISSQFKKIGSYKRGLSDEKAYFYSMERMVNLFIN